MDPDAYALLRVLHVVEHPCSWCGAPMSPEVWDWDAATYDQAIAERIASGHEPRVVTHGLCRECSSAMRSANNSQ